MFVFEMGWPFPHFKTSSWEIVHHKWCRDNYVNIRNHVCVIHFAIHLFIHLVIHLTIHFIIHLAIHFETHLVIHFTFMIHFAIHFWVAGIWFVKWIAKWIMRWITKSVCKFWISVKTAHRSHRCPADTNKPKHPRGTYMGMRSGSACSDTTTSSVSEWITGLYSFHSTSHGTCSFVTFTLHTIYKT